MWEEYGITSYIRGSSQQLIWQSYYILEETLKYEKPKAVVFNVLSMKYGTPQNEAYNRMTLDQMKWSDSKLNSIKASMTEEESLISYIFPIFRYHSRWNQLGKDDFKYHFSRDEISHNGYLMQVGEVPKTSDREGKPLDNYEFSETSYKYLDAMRKLCEDNDIELILIKAPTNSWKYYWYDEWDEQIIEYSEKYNLTYYNFLDHIDEIGIDWNTDSYDGGIHLNVKGAEKLSKFFGNLLVEDFNLKDRRSDVELASIWSKKSEVYYGEKAFLYSVEENK
jgi:inorganic pyrophosphatase